ncbi:hypothetical protein AB0G42_18870 [Streptomyces yangpuensis]|uniref:hypothetical protein n=1 Tax=Streptomyces yangpuensis TaxID=1648182 RepID=UPI00341726CF
MAHPGGAELLYWPDTCTGIGDYLLRALPNTRVGLLRADAPRTAEASVSGILYVWPQASR